MRHLLLLTLVLALAAPALAFDLGPRPSAKPIPTHPQNVPSPTRQGGDTILDAVEIVVPIADVTGTTAGYNDDYDEICPYSNSTSPDVVYTFTPDADYELDIDLCGSSYDTKLYLYDANLDLVACNDDFYFDDACGVYVSMLEAVSVAAGMPYYLVIDGYGGAFGDYLLNVVQYEPCVIECPASSVLEGEPPLVDGYDDWYNGGCNSPQHGNPFQPLTAAIFCGQSGWYIHASGATYRDTDWFTTTVLYEGFVEITADAEFASYIFELGPQDCENVAVIQNVGFGPCVEGNIVIPGPVGSTVWVWVGPQTFEDPATYDYVLWRNWMDATEAHSWSDVKSIFD